MNRSMQVWSAGLEEWEDAHLDLHDRAALVHVHDKRIGYELFAFFQDPLNRWFKAPLGPVSSEPAVTE